MKPPRKYLHNSSTSLFILRQGLEPSPLYGTTVRYLVPSVALFEAVDDDLLPLKPIGIQVTYPQG